MSPVLSLASVVSDFTNNNRKGRGALLGFFLGAASGVIQFWMLSRFTKAVTNSQGRISFNNKFVLLAVSQIFFPMIILACCALLLRQSLLWIGVSMAASLIVCAIARFLSTFIRHGR